MTMNGRISGRIASVVTIGAAAAAFTVSSAQPLAAQVELTVTSSAFEEGGAIPVRNSAYGENLSPEIMWSGAPAGTESFALVLTDPDVPMPNGFVHWTIYNIPGSATGLPEGISADAQTLDEPASIAGTTQGVMGMRNPGFFGPRPPAGGGPHDYVFTVYALDADLDLAPGLGRDELMAAMEGHVIAQGAVTGVFEQEG